MKPKDKTKKKKSDNEKFLDHVKKGKYSDQVPLTATSSYLRLPSGDEFFVEIPETTTVVGLTSFS